MTSTTKIEITMESFFFLAVGPQSDENCSLRNVGALQAYSEPLDPSPLRFSFRGLYTRVHSLDF